MASLRRSSLLYPGGAVPDFDPNHIAANGSSGNSFKMCPGYGYSAIAVGSTMVNLVTGRPAVVSGTAPAGVQSIIGPASYSSANGNWGMTNSDPNTGSRTDATCAVICVFQTVPAANGNDQILCVNANGVTIVVNASTSPGGTIGFGNVTNIATTFVPVVGVPYFIAMTSNNGPNIGHVLILNLLTGARYVLNNQLSTQQSSGTTSFIGANAAPAGPSLAYIAAAMASPAYIGISGLSQWGNDPWSFWYPFNKPNLKILGIAPAPSVAALAARSAIIVEGRAAFSGAASLQGRSAGMAKARAASIGVVPLLVRATSSFKSNAQFSGAVGLSGRVSSQAKTSGPLAFLALLSGRIATIAKPRLSLGGAAALAGRMTMATKTAATLSGVASLAGRIAAQVKARSPLGFVGLAALVGRIAAAIRFGGAPPSMGAGTPFKFVQPNAQIFRFGNVPVGQAHPIPKNPMLVGVAAMSGRATAQSKISGFVTSSMFVALAGRVATMVKARPGPATGAVALAGRITTMAKERAVLSISTLVLLVGSIVAAIKVKGLAGGSVPLVARVTAAAQSRASVAGAAALAGRTIATTKLAAASSGVVGLAGRLTTQIKVVPGLVNSAIAALVGRVAAMVMARGQTTGAATLSARMTAQARSSGLVTGTVLLVGRITAQVQSRVQVLTGAFVFMVGRISSMAKARGLAAGTAMLAGRATAQAKATAAFSGAVGLAGRITSQTRVQPALAFLTALVGRTAIAVRASAPVRAAANLAGIVKTAVAARAAAPTGTLALRARTALSFTASGSLGIMQNFVGMFGRIGSMFRSSAPLKGGNPAVSAQVVVTSGSVQMTVT